MLLHFRKFFIAFLILAQSAASAQAASPVTARASGGVETVTITLPAKGPYRVFTLGNPDRLVVDVPAMGGKVDASLPSGFRGNLIQAARYGQFDPKTSRFVFELSGPVKVQETSEDGNKPFRLSVSIVSTGAGKTETSASIKPGKTKVTSTSVDGDTRTVVEETPAPVKKKQSKPVIVIDAGHGGVDPGAIGSGGVQEKDVTLAYAKALREALLRTGKYKVVLTREDDRFILLRKRVQMAREAGGSLFISLHADSAPDMDARGLSLYTLSENASDAEAEALAERENKADIIAGVDLSHESHDVAGILISLAQRETMNESSVLANRLVAQVSPSVKTLPHPHRFAGFAVLKAPDMPSVLVELGFLSSRQDAKLLLNPKQRDKVVKALAKGIDSYFTKKGKN